MPVCYISQRPGLALDDKYIPTLFDKSWRPYLYKLISYQNKSACNNNNHEAKLIYLLKLWYMELGIGCLCKGRTLLSGQRSSRHFFLKLWIVLYFYSIFFFKTVWYTQCILLGEKILQYFLCQNFKTVIISLKI